MRGLGSGHVTRGPMRGLEKNGKKKLKKKVELRIFFSSTNERPGIWSCDLWANERPQKKSRIRETLNLSTDADHRTHIFFGGGMVKKKRDM